MYEPASKHPNTWIISMQVCNGKIVVAILYDYYYFQFALCRTMTATTTTATATTSSDVIELTTIETQAVTLDTAEQETTIND